MLAAGARGDAEAAGCRKDADCGACRVCEKRRGRKSGTCGPDRSKDGRRCSGCLACANGWCGVPDDALCAGGERCRPGVGPCCPRCLADACCPAGQACVDPGLLGASFCCDASLNAPCGPNGDGTFRQCCSNLTEACVAGECRPKDECPPGRTTRQGLCCAEPGKLCEGRGRCCGAREFCNPADRCEDPFRCPREACSSLGNVCCEPNGFTDAAYCCPPSQVCANTVVGCAVPR